MLCCIQQETNTMFELLLVVDIVTLGASPDAVNAYEGDVPPSATFQTVDNQSTVQSDTSTG